MKTTRARERIAAGVLSALEKRAGPDDHIEWDVTVVLADEPCEDDYDRLHHVTMVAFYLALECPATGTASVANVMVPIASCTDSSRIAALVDKVWDAVVLNRMEYTFEAPVGEVDPLTSEENG